jgi:N-acetylmuramoyl-L-alanine amidase
VRLEGRWRACGGVIVVLLAGLLAGCGGGSAPKPAGAPGNIATPPTAGGGVAAKKAPEKKASAENVLDGKVIVLDPGHNGGDAEHPEIANKLVDVITKRKPCDAVGTQSASGYPEHAFTWDVANRLKKLLQAKGAKVVLTRSSDKGVGPCITERAAIGNRNKADAALSIHADGAPKRDHGFHIIEPLPIKGHNEEIVPDSKKLGRAMRDSYREGTGLPYSTYRGKHAIDARDDLGGLNLSTRPKVFIECGNMKHPGDAAKLESAGFRQRIAAALSDGFVAYFS